MLTVKPNRADYIKHPSADENIIADIPVEKVYEWVKTGHWKQKDFKRWLTVLRVIENKE